MTRAQQNANSIARRLVWALLKWRWRFTNPRGWTAPRLADSLTVEGLPYEQTPLSMGAHVCAFRKLRHDQRLKVCVRFVEARR